MAILTDLPNELLLQIIADISPLDLEFFLLSCKRIHLLGSDAAREHHLVKQNLKDLTACQLLDKVISDASTALYPTSIDFWSDCISGTLDLPFDVNVQALKTLFARRDGSNSVRADLSIPVLFALLLNLRKIHITICHQPYLIDIVAQIVEASHDTTLTLQEPLALGRLAEVLIRSSCWQTDCLYGEYASHAMTLSILLAMIPSVR